MSILAPAVGAPVARLEGRLKVTGEARYAYEHELERIAYGWIVHSELARGRVESVEVHDALSVPGAVAVFWHANAPAVERVSNAELAVLQSSEVAYRGQIVACAVAETLEAAREAASRVKVLCASEPHDVVLRTDHPKLFEPDTVNPSYPGRTERGDPDRALSEAEVAIDCTYSTPAAHNKPMEPHSAVAFWHNGSLTVHDSTQGAPMERDQLATVFGLEREQVRVISEHVGGGFGSKGTPRPHVVLAAMCAKELDRPVKIAVTRQQMFAFVGYRTPTIQRLRIGARRDGTLTALIHDATMQTSTVHEFAEQVAICSRTMYASPNSRTTHSLAALDVPTPSWMRAPGECPGMYALECAIDELALACDVDPVELRVRNDPPVDPSNGHPWSSRNLVACLRKGSELFGWAERDPTPRARREGSWLVGTGVAASTYPAFRRDSQALARAEADGGFTVMIGAADIGTGARTVLAQVAADELEVPLSDVRMLIGDSSLPHAFLAGGSGGTASWSAAVVLACRLLRERLSAGEDLPCEAFADTADEVARDRRDVSRYSFGAQFAEARVNVDTGEVRVGRLLGVFAAGRILNPVTARSQFVGGMTMGMSMALHEESVIDREFGDYLNHDLAQYHVAACADVLDIDATWIEEQESELGPMGAKGIGEIGIVGTAAAVANAVFHATGVRVRDLPIVPAKLLCADPSVAQ
ncbi:MAG: xanthine dehydrogenase family protein molybdopterin-binding subunit [Solirubrobacteraceae bacterium]